MKPHKRVVFCRAFSVPVLFLLALAGCSRNGPSGVVTGKVSYKGETLTAGIVAFNLPGGQEGKSAPISADGTYKAEGVPLGQVVVTVTTPTAQPPTAEQAAKNPFLKKKGYVPKQGVKVVSIPPKYSKPALSDLRLTVHEGTQPFDIDLK
jgi:hypothetical protein